MEEKVKIEEKSSLGEMLNEGIEVELGDGKKHILKQLGIVDIKNIEKELGISFITVNFNSFEVASTILFHMLRKTEKNLTEEKLNEYFPLRFMSSQKYATVLETINKLLVGEDVDKIPNVQKPEEQKQ